MTLVLGVLGTRDEGETVTEVIRLGADNVPTRAQMALCLLVCREALEQGRGTEGAIRLIDHVLAPVTKVVDGGPVLGSVSVRPEDVVTSGSAERTAEQVSLAQHGIIDVTDLPERRGTVTRIDEDDVNDLEASLDRVALQYVVEAWSSNRSTGHDHIKRSAERLKNEMLHAACHLARPYVERAIAAEAAVAS